MNARKLLDWRKLLIYTHRWMGIFFGIVFLAWFISGIAFMYWGMPSLSEGERLGHITPLDLSTVEISPAEAADLYLADPGRLRIEMYTMAVPFIVSRRRGSTRIRAILLRVLRLRKRSNSFANGFPNTKPRSDTMRIWRIRTNGRFKPPSDTSCRCTA